MLGRGRGRLRDSGNRERETDYEKRFHERQNSRRRIVRASSVSGERRPLAGSSRQLAANRLAQFYACCSMRSASAERYRLAACAPQISPGLLFET